MRKVLIGFIAAAALLLSAQSASATTFQVIQGGTGSSTLTGILVGNGKNPINTLTIGTNLTLSGTTLSASGGGSSFSTTSADFWILQYPKGFFFSTTSVAYWQSVNNFFSTTSANYWKTQTTFTGASTTILTDTNWWTGRQNFSNATTSGLEATSSNIFLDGYTSALLSVNASHQVAAYTGSSNPCAANQAPTTLSALAVLGGCTSTFLTGNQAVTLTGAVSGSGATSIATTFNYTPWGGSIAGGAISSTTLAIFNGGASSSVLSLNVGPLYVGGTTATTTIQGQTTGTSTLQGFLTVSGSNSTSTFSGNLSAAAFNATGNSTITYASTTAWSITSTSTGTNGIKITGGCFQDAGGCLTHAGGGSVTSITLASPNSTFSLSGTNPVTTSGTINADLNLAHSNWWTALQNFTNATTSGFEATSTSIFFSGIKNALLSTNGQGQVVATTSVGVNYLSGILPTANGGTGSSNLGSGAVSAASGVLSAGTLSIANGGTNQTTFGTTNGITAFDGTRFTNFTGYLLTSSLLTAPNASTTSFSVSGTNVAGTSTVTSYITPTHAISMPYATSTTWTGTSSPTVMNADYYVIPFNSKLYQVVCVDDAGTIYADISYGSTHLTAIPVTSTIATTSEATTLGAGVMVKVVYGTPASSPTSAFCNLFLIQQSSGL